MSLDPNEYRNKKKKKTVYKNNRKKETEINQQPSINDPHPYKIKKQNIRNPPPLNARARVPRPSRINSHNERYRTPPIKTHSTRSSRITPHDKRYRNTPIKAHPPRSSRIAPQNKRDRITPLDAHENVPISTGESIQDLNEMTPQGSSLTKVPESLETSRKRKSRRRTKRISKRRTRRTSKRRTRRKSRRSKEIDISNFSINSKTSKCIITIEAILKIASHSLKYANKKMPQNDWVEIIGLLSGKIESDILIIEDAYPMGHGNAIHAEIKDYNNYIRAWKDIRKSDEFIVGWYHSHPSYSPFISEEDFGTQSRYQTLLDTAVALVIDPFEIDGTRFGFEIFQVDLETGEWFAIPFEVRGNLDARLLPEILKFIEPIIEGRALFLEYDKKRKRRKKNNKIIKKKHLNKFR